MEQHLIVIASLIPFEDTHLNQYQNAKESLLDIFLLLVDNEKQSYQNK